MVESYLCFLFDDWLKVLGSDIGFCCNYKRCLCSHLYRDSIIMLPENYYLVIKMYKCYSNQIHAENYWLVLMMLHNDFFLFGETQIVMIKIWWTYHFICSHLNDSIVETEQKC